jgi:hypothetical protein
MSQLFIGVVCFLQISEFLAEEISIESDKY